ncbi:HlyC/CorC family transporter [Oceanospirillaceae bacterium]|nr:HlyC/CorC family transporter [Oceanospirillaceae bacterium]MDC1351079.1 HlyC/CorC family transporter [Oceanospirillaceae bacterium]MDC1507417.1 HlyC/CorC family transporter [Oceanospirillaceae bacterium]MDO7573162.1 HlyC/CorC family transporter [Oceanospirillaceae bacterium]MDO7584659.1 HlyC/CorC family transporter [Oceanospirillaceae bacterium]
MSEIPLGYLFSSLAFLILLSAFFSSSETGMMSLNRYRLRHLVKQKHRGAMRASRLLDRPDRLIGVILIGNNFVNILASAIATMIALRLMGDAGVAVATAMLTLVILIFAEVTPKTVAAIKPEQVAFPASLILSPLLKLLYPFVWLVNTICNGLLRMLGFNAAAKVNDHLSSEELRTIVHEAGALIPRRNQSMLLSILDLDTVTVEDIMIPRNEIVGIDINDDISTILNTISQSPHTRIPLYQEELNNVVGMVHVRQILPLMYAEKPSKEEFLALAQEPYFVPESTPLNTQLLNFQKRKYWVALVVDEYGDIQGLTTLEDILEEIVGDMAEEQDLENDDIHAQEDGSFFIDGTTTVRDINKALTWSLPIDGPKTLNGLITERLEEIPQFNVCLKLGEYHLETVQIRGNFIKTVRLHRVEVTAEEVH